MDSYIGTLVGFPCDGKRPTVSQWTKLRTPVPRRSGMNYGVLTGREPNGLTVLDLDIVKSPQESAHTHLCGIEAYRLLLARCGISRDIDTPTVRTRSGGMHVYFKYSEALGGGGVQRLKGRYFGCDEKIVKVDVLADKRFVVAVGEGYVQINTASEPVDMPAALEREILAAMSIAAHTPTTVCCDSIAVSKQTLAETLRSLPDRCAEDYETWTRVLWATKHTADANGYCALDLADEFSRRCPQKYAGVEEVRRVYEAADGRVTYGTLMHLRNNVGGGDNLKNIKTEILVADLNEFDDLSKVKRVNDIFESGQLKIINVTLEDDSVRDVAVYKNNLVTMTNKEFIGYLRNIVRINEDLSVIHPEFKDNATSNCHMHDVNTIDFVYRTDMSGEQKIRVKHPWDPKKSYLVKYSNAKQLGNVVRDKRMLSIVKDALESGCHKLLQDRYNIAIFLNANLVFGNGEENIRSESRMITDLFEAHPGIVDFFKFFDSKASSFDGVYNCSAVTGIWRREHNGRIEQMLESRIKKHLTLTPQELKFIETHGNVQNLRKMFVKRIIDDDFENVIDENLNIFATLNGVHDITDMSFRTTKPQDYAMTNCGWKYEKGLALAHAKDVTKFFEKLMPVVEEREVLLRFLASSMHGYRLDKKVLLLTDRRNGNNGKSTLLTMLRQFFGGYLKSNTKFICRGAFEKDKDSHDAGMEPLKGKRMLVADELKKHMRLDEGLIKNLAGGPYTVEGRRIGRVDVFRFTWQANIVMVFNEGDCPQFDSTDKAFMNRLLVCPMRSRFEAGLADDDTTTNTYVMDPNISDKFRLWNSALMDLLRSYLSDTRGLLNTKIPRSMLEWKEDIVEKNNELSEWIMSQVEITDDRKDFVSLNDLKDMYRCVHGVRSLSDRAFIDIAKALFDSKNLEYVNMYKYYVDGQRKQKRQVYLKLRLATN